MTPMMMMTMKKCRKKSERQHYTTHPRDGRYVPIRTNPEEDTLQLRTDSEIPGTVWNRHKGTPKPEVIQKPANFLQEDNTTPGLSSRI